jgi:hypothetical protein
VFGVDLSLFSLLEVGFDLFCWLFGHRVSGDGNNFSSGFFLYFLFRDNGVLTWGLNTSGWRGISIGMREGCTDIKLGGAWNKR